MPCQKRCELVSPQSDPSQRKPIVIGFDLIKRIRDSDLDTLDKLTALVFASHVNEAGLAWPAIETIAAMISRDRRTATRCVTKLIEYGFLEPRSSRKGGPGLSTIFFLNAAPLRRDPKLDALAAAREARRRGSGRFMDEMDNNPDTDVMVNDHDNPDTGDMVNNQPCHPRPLTMTPVTANHDTGVRGTVHRTVQGTVQALTTAECTELDQEQVRTKRAPPQDVVSVVGWGIRSADRAAFETELTTLAMPGPFASAKTARLWGYRVFDHRPNLAFDVHADRLLTKLLKLGIATSIEQCRSAMCDVYDQRSMRDRAWDPQAARDRRVGRR
jgi:hypothetical protein